jgi:hypothetical protein
MSTLATQEVSAMDPIEVREETVATNTGAEPGVPATEAVPAGDVAPAERGFPVRGSTESTAVPAAAAPVAAAPVAAAPGAAAPVAPAAARTSVTTSRVGVYPVGYRTIQLIWLIVGVVDIILALDFIFKAANANNTGFAHYIFRLGGWLAAPFNGIFNNTATNGTVFRWADVLAVVIYTVAAWIITKLVRITATPRTGPSNL